MEDLPLPERQQAEPAYEELNTKWEAAVAVSNKEGAKPPKLLKVRQRGVHWAAGGGGGVGSGRGEPYHLRLAHELALTAAEGHGSRLCMHAGRMVGRFV